MDQGLEQPGTSRGPLITGQAAGHGANGEGLVMGLETERKPRWGGYLWSPHREPMRLCRPRGATGAQMPPLTVGPAPGRRPSSR